jgi:hypothetical protein
MTGRRVKGSFTAVRVLAGLTLLLLVAACSTDAASGGASTSPSSGPGRGDTAVWSINPGENLTSVSQSFTAQVSRLGCNGGVTGAVLDPTITFGANEIVVTFTVESLPPGTYRCPSNVEVPSVVNVGQPIGDRKLVDGACRASDARTTVFCVDGATRWSP